MAQLSLARAWHFDVERGPDWLFVRPRPAGAGNDQPAFAEQVWSLLEQHFTHRLVLELGGIDFLDSHLVGQLVWLHKRVHTHDGLMRICELSEHSEDVLHACRLDSHFPVYRNREDAVMGHAHPRHPR